jgi:hypothetical protein
VVVVAVVVVVVVDRVVDIAVVVDMVVVVVVVVDMVAAIVVDMVVVVVYVHNTVLVLVVVVVVVGMIAMMDCKAVVLIMVVVLVHHTWPVGERNPFEGCWHRNRHCVKVVVAGASVVVVADVDGVGDTLRVQSTHVVMHNLAGSRRSVVLVGQRRQLAVVVVVVGCHWEQILNPWMYHRWHDDDRSRGDGYVLSKLQ